MPDYFHKISFQDFRTFELNKFITKLQVTDVFSFSNFCFLFTNNFQKLYIVNYNLMDVVAYLVNLYEEAPKIFGKFKFI